MCEKRRVCKANGCEYPSGSAFQGMRGDYAIRKGLVMASLKRLWGWAGTVVAPSSLDFVNGRRTAYLMITASTIRH